MGEFTRTVSIGGKYSELNIVNGKFCDPETGEFVDVVGELEKVYGTNVFSLSTSYKAKEALDGEE